MRVIIALLISSLTILYGCSGNDKPDEDLGEKRLYELARKQIDSSNYTAAVKNLQLLESRYPFGPYAEQAQLELIYAHARSYDNEAAIAAADRFIRLHPQHPNADYAYYMRGLEKFTQGKGLFERFLPTDMSQRDPGDAREAFNDFSQLLTRFPDSDYAPDARARMIYLRNLLARYEINVANYYFKRGAYLAATNRGRNVLENYPESAATADALAVIVQGYLLLGYDDLANDTLDVLRKNYPDYPSLDENGNFITKFTHDAVKRSWINKITLGLFDRTEPPRFDNRKDWE